MRHTQKVYEKDRKICIITKKKLIDYCLFTCLYRWGLLTRVLLMCLPPGVLGIDL